MFGFGRLLLLIFAECMGLLTRGIPIAPIATTRNSSMHIKQYDYGRKTKKKHCTGVCVLNGALGKCSRITIFSGYTSTLHTIYE